MKPAQTGCSADNNNTTNHREVGSPIGAYPSSLYQKRKVEIRSFTDLCKHYNSYYPQAFPSNPCRKITQQVEVEHDSKKASKGKYKKILHQRALPVVSFSVFAKDKFVSITEKLA